MPFKLHYFNMKGRAEVIRLLFAEAGEDFEDVTIEKDDWPSRKESIPFGTVPVLEEDGEWLSQTASIIRYLANKFGLAGENEREKAIIDSYYELSHDFIQPFVFTVLKETDEDKKKEAAKKWFDETLSPKLTHIEKILENREFLVGNKVSYADIHFFAILSGMKESFSEEKFEKFKGKFPKIVDHMERIAKRPNIAKYRELHSDRPSVVTFKFD